MLTETALPPPCGTSTTRARTVRTGPSTRQAKRSACPSSTLAADTVKIVARSRGFAGFGGFGEGCSNTWPPPASGAAAPPLWASVGAGTAASRRPAASETSRKDIHEADSALRRPSATRERDPSGGEHAAHQLRRAQLGQRLVEVAALGRLHARGAALL